MSQDIFQRKIHQTNDNCQSPIEIAHGLQVFGYLNLHETIERIRKAAIKCIFKSKSCSYFGNVYNPQGMKPDPKKIQAIRQMQAPSTKQELNSFLSMVNYPSHFIPAMYNLNFNLKKFLQNDVLFQWTDSHDKDFHELRNDISSDTWLVLQPLLNQWLYKLMHWRWGRELHLSRRTQGFPNTKRVLQKGQPKIALFIP